MRIIKAKRCCVLAPFQADMFRTDSQVFNLARVVVPLAIGLLSGPLANAASVLVNPGAETGDSTGWTLGAKASVVSTNGYQWNNGTNYPPYASNILVHTGGYAFKSYQDSGAASTLIYQDIAAGAGSQWTAACWALSHAQDYIGAGNNAHLQVVFYDNATNALAVYGSAVLDPSNVGFPFTEVPPMGLGPGDWLYLQVTNTYSSDPASEANWSGANSGSLVAPAGTAWVRYQLEFDDPTGAGGAMFWDDCDLEKVVGSDPDIVTAPTAQVVVVGQNATFTVLGSGSTTLSYQWKKGSANVSGPRMGGANSQTLTITNCFQTDSGAYSVVITDTHGSIQSIPVNLTVLNPAAANNALGPNAGFENAPIWSPWNPFNGTGLPSTNSTYYLVTNLVNVYDGKYCAQVYAGSTDNGWWIHIPCSPGSVWKAAGHAYITSTTDNFAGSNTCRLQVWFQDGSNNHIGPSYESFKIFGLAYTNIYPMLPRDTWVYLPVTNVVDATDTPTNFVQNFVAPAGASVINYQVYYYHPAGNPGGSVFWDDMELYQLFPVTNVTVSVSGNNVNVSFPSRGGSLYGLVYKDNLPDASWNVLPTTIQGTGGIVTLTDTNNGSKRFYRVQTQ
jgi:hypothetical protein